MTRLVGGRLFDQPERVSISIHDGLITSISTDGSDDSGDQEDDRAIDLSGLTVAPGLIDIQINGAYGSDFTSDPDSIWLIGARLPEQGVTAFLPTIITSPQEAIDAARFALADRPDDYIGAEPLGLHLEGPMLSARRPGIHDPALMRAPSLDLIKDWSKALGVAMVTMAPELAGSHAVIKTLIGSGVVVAAGHTAATMAEAEEGFESGIKAVTHIFNAMEPFDHRAPGLIGAVVRHPTATAGIIADGLHSDPAVVLAAWRLLGPKRLLLVTDAMAATGLGDGTFNLGSLEVNVKQGQATDSNGRLAGSTLTLDQAVRNLVEFAGSSWADAWAAASSVPAHLLGLDDRGRIAVGRRADMVLLDDSMQVAATMVGGRLLHIREGLDL